MLALFAFLMALAILGFVASAVIDAARPCQPATNQFTGQVQGC